MNDPQTDRRSQARIAMSRPCKILDCASGRYYAGITHDLTDRSLLLSVHLPLPWKPGQRVAVGVAMLRRQGLLQAKEMIDAEVVRVLRTEDGRTTLAVQYVGARPAAAPAHREAA